ncbi:unnamed protein product [Linum tenue]|uniref:Uncharacterized protein n=1 Tax=Linum tenue TaxID=586396 RepID=A0AAV0HEQ4_9ROSI|nr:unnamed protein product [Linum tenue]
MKQENSCSLPAYFEEHEYEVASILLDLPLLIAQSKSVVASSNHSIPLFWSGKRKRSSLSGGGRIDSSPLSPSPSLQQPTAAEEKISAVRGEPKPKEKKADSPTTPLSLSLSEAEESCEKPARGKRRGASAVSKKSRKDLMEKVAESEEQGKVLQKEIENVTRYYKILEEENSKLKAIERQLRLGKEEGRPGLTEAQYAQPRAGSFAVSENGGGELQSRKVWCVAPCSSSCSSSDYNNYGSGIGIDLNSESGNVGVCFPVGEGRWDPILGDSWRRPFDDLVLRAAAAAQARKRRVDKMKEKERRRGLNFRASSGGSSSRRVKQKETNLSVQDIWAEKLNFF